MGMRVLRALPVVLLALLVVTSGGGARTHKPKPHCAVPRGWHVVARNAQAVVIANEAVERQGPTRLRGCIYRLNLTRIIDSSGWATAGRGRWFTAVSIAGLYVTYSIIEADREESHYLTDGPLYDLATGRRWTLSGGGPGPRLLTPTGIVVWITPGYFSPSGGPPYTFYVRSLSALSGKTSTLDSAVTNAPTPRPLANLQLVQCVAGCSPVGAYFAWWTHDGAWRSARVG